MLGIRWLCYTAIFGVYIFAALRLYLLVYHVARVERAFRVAVDASRWWRVFLRRNLRYRLVENVLRLLHEARLAVLQLRPFRLVYSRPDELAECNGVLAELL